jgi:uncharacterized protein (DUF488 family)
MSNTTIFTIGHSTHPIETFIGMLHAHEIRLLADVRTIPKSRHNPQFNTDALTASLKAAGVDYRHLTGLGGLRHAKKDSLNQGWENASFRGFADYMRTAEFENSLNELIGLAGKQRTAIMCAEALPWRCHRSLISDALFARGIPVTHIMSRTSVKSHAMTPWAVVEGTTITYPKPRES